MSLATAQRPVRRPAPPRLALGLVVACAVLAVVVLLSLAVGTKSLPVTDVVGALVHPGHSYADTVVASRVPRTELGLLVGAALAVAGAVMQGITRNPLADPGLFGVNIGAAAAVVTGSAFLGLGSASASVLVALPGAFAAVVIVYLIGSGGGRTTPVRLVLAGVVVSAVLAAYIQAITLSLPAVFDQYRFWVIGSLAGRNPALVGDILPFIVAGLLLASSLGAHVGRTRLLGAIATSLLCAASTAAVGPIAFVGLAVPHIARARTGGDHRWLLPYSLVIGPVLLLAADIVARVVASPAEIMVGIVTAFVGAPVLVLAVRRMRTGA